MSERAFTIALMTLAAGLGALMLQILRWAFERTKKSAGGSTEDTIPPSPYKSRSSQIAAMERVITHVKELGKMTEEIKRNTAPIPSMATETHEVREIVAQVDDDRVPLVYSRKSLERAIDGLTEAAKAQTAMVAELVSKLA